MKRIFWSLMFSVVTSSAFALDCHQAQLNGHRLSCETQYLYDLGGREDLQNPAPQQVLTVEFEAIDEHESSDAPECKASATMVDSLTGYKFNAQSDSQRKISVTVYEGPQNEVLFSSAGVSKESQAVSTSLYLSKKNIYGVVPSKTGSVSLKLSSLQLSCQIQ
jgi:hypothetical protein